MMQRIVSIFLLLFILSCDSKVNYKKPDNLIPKDQMIELLYDMHVAVGAVNVKNKKLEKNRNYMSLVYEKHNVDSTRFAISNIYYVSKAKEYEEMFEVVESRLKELNNYYEDSLDSLMQAGGGAKGVMKPVDSVRRIKKINK